MRRLSILLAMLAALMLVPVAQALAAQPIVNEVSPDSGPVAGGTEVTITGTALESATKVEFDSTEVSSGEFIENTATTIKLVAPAHAPGVVDISVTTPEGTNANNGSDNYAYRPTVTVEFEGTGEGEVSSLGGLFGFWEGTPAIECFYESPEPGVGICENEAGFAFSTTLADALYVEPEPGSEFAGWSILEGASTTDFPGQEEFSFCRKDGSENAEEEAYGAGKHWCFPGLKFGEGGENAKVVAAFCLEGESREECGLPPLHALSVTTSGEGSGTVFSSPTAIACGSVCEAEWLEGEEVTLEAATDEGSEFTGWTGCDSESEGDCIVTMSEAKEVEAEFAEEEAATQPLSFNINEGEGTVVSDPAGLECTGSEGESCEASFEEGAEVTLTASPAAGYRFYNWQTCPAPSGRQCTVTMSEAKEVGVRFKKTWKLTVSEASGSEPGIIKALPTGVACPLYCSSSTYTFLDGQEVTIDRYEPIGYLHFTEFTAGTGSAEACNGLSTPCAITLEEDSSIDALFEENAKATLSLQKEGGGQAKITSSGNQIYCFNSCDSGSGSYYTEPSATEVTVSWDLGVGTTSIEWTTGAGTCTGSSSSDTGSCKVTMSEAHELVAKLE